MTSSNPPTIHVDRLSSRPAVARATGKTLEALARDRKVAKLLAVLERAAFAAGVPVLTAEHVDGTDWAAVARIADCNPPSALTVALLRRRLALGGAL
jgi:hypothetical protein